MDLPVEKRWPNGNKIGRTTVRCNIEGVQSADQVSVVASTLHHYIPKYRMIAFPLVDFQNTTHRIQSQAFGVFHGNRRSYIERTEIECRPNEWYSDGERTILSNVSDERTDTATTGKSSIQTGGAWESWCVKRLSDQRLGEFHCRDK